jgi:hypothetical protein
MGKERNESAKIGPDVEVPCRRIKVCVCGVPRGGWIICGARCSCREVREDRDGLGISMGDPGAGLGFLDCIKGGVRAKIPTVGSMGKEDERWSEVRDRMRMQCERFDGN